MCSCCNDARLKRDESHCNNNMITKFIIFQVSHCLPSRELHPPPFPAHSIPPHHPMNNYFLRCNPSLVNQRSFLRYVMYLLCSCSRACPPLLSHVLFPYRHWQELGFLIVYVTSRPDFQKMKVMAWLAEHNFPYGLVTFGNGISKDLQRHKTEFLRYLVSDVSNLLLYNAQSLRERKPQELRM